MYLFALALIAGTVANKEELEQVVPDIVYKYTDAYQLIWRDEGSSADQNGAVWRALNYQSQFCSLGDAATTNWDRPEEKAVFVSQRKEGALVNPTSFSLVWTDRGSDSDRDVAFYRMNAPSGYTCLGGVAVASYRAKPDPKKYCCVRTRIWSRETPCPTGATAARTPVSTSACGL